MFKCVRVFVSEPDLPGVRQTFMMLVFSHNHVFSMVTFALLGSLPLITEASLGSHKDVVNAFLLCPLKLLHISLKMAMYLKKK